MGEACNRVVRSFGTWWTFVGWCLFFGTLFLPLIPDAIPLAMISFLLMLVWWVIDATDQTVPAWQVITGILMIIGGMLPRGGLLFIGAWVIYWFKVRE